MRAAPYRGTPTRRGDVPPSRRRLFLKTGLQEAIGETNTATGSNHEPASKFNVRMRLT
jgi:hypothetical protein